MNQITDAYGQGKYTLGIFIDLSKAFDTVNHNNLLEKLKAYGIQYENLIWFTSYLSNRKQFISYGDSKTEMKIVKCGVLQGSILGPTNLFCSSSDIRAVFETANQELGQISDWFYANKLSLNAEKNKIYVTSQTHRSRKYPFKIAFIATEW